MSEPSGYAQPDVLVSSEWVAEHLNDPNVRLAESNEDVLLYSTGHIPGAVNIDWHNDLNDPLVRDYISPVQFAELMSRNGITPETTVIFYGDKNNWWATYAFWVFQLFGHTNAKLLDGGRAKWINEGRELSRERPSYPRTSYPLPKRDDATVRAFRDDVLKQIVVGKPLVDVRSPGEFKGELLHMADYPQEGSLRGGHIPGAKSVPWARAANPDGTFKSADELRAIYEQEQGLKPEDGVITYCRIGERSSHSWFVLTYLLGYPNVRNYDGSWTEWGNGVRLPIER
ncbi:MAG: sulfurtransferase [Caldilineaceae bacterium]|nr:sulfurtransferase [Caldilineaceae bacterium]MBP8293241.1 sulfurtransferase [Caldilineaceae bacterium]